jgi:hypothetical protein
MGRDVPGRSGEARPGITSSGLRPEGIRTLVGFARIAAASPQSSEIIKELIEPVDNEAALFVSNYFA